MTLNLPGNEAMVTQQNQTGWLSVYLFYKGPLDEILRQLIGPFINEVYGHYINQYFFIRYYENGPHIRLRLKGDKLTLEKTTKSKLIQATNEYFSTAPYVKNGSVQIVPYEPELDRYGGRIGTAIAEKMFQVSSAIVLQILSLKEWNFQKAVGASLQLNLIQLFLFFEDKTEIKKFVEFEHQNWLQLSIGIKEDNEFESNYLVSEQVLAYKKQSGYIKEALHNIWTRLENDVPFGDKNMDEWKKSINEIFVEFKFYQTEIISQSTMISSKSSDSSDFNLRKWFIIASYLHMTNNRLGLLYKDECYTYYILKNILSDLF
jgi:thiopeptide-type bacteriocin biosynthesis protein